MCKYKLQEIFLRKTQYQEYCLIECFETSRKLPMENKKKKNKTKTNKQKQTNKNKIGSLLFEAMIDTWTFLMRKIINLA